MTNSDVYPVTAGFEQWYEAALDRLFTKDPQAKVPEGLNTAYEAVRTALGEYEHGSADVDQVFEGTDMATTYREYRASDLDDRPLYRQMLQIYANVCTDVILTMLNLEETDAQEV